MITYTNFFLCLLPRLQEQLVSDCFTVFSPPTRSEPEPDACSHRDPAPPPKQPSSIFRRLQGVASRDKSAPASAWVASSLRTYIIRVLYLLCCRVESAPKGALGMEELKRAKKFALIIESNLWEGIFVFDKGVNSVNLCVQKIIYDFFF